MFDWFRRERKIICQCCNSSFKSAKPDKIKFETSDGTVETWKICNLCAAQLELIKKRHEESFPLRIDYD